MRRLFSKKRLQRRRNWAQLGKTLASRRELAAPGRKVNKDRISALVCLY